MGIAPNADRFEELPREQTERWDSFPIPTGHGDAVYSPRYLGIQLETVNSRPCPDAKASKPMLG